MGYSTKFNLDYRIDEFIDDAELITALNEVTGYDWEDDFFIEGKWYDWKDDMVKVSGLFPDVLFVLEGAGEDSDDLWKAYFKNGKVQIENARIVYGEFDETKLK